MGDGAQTGGELQVRIRAPETHAAMNEIAFDPADAKAALAQLPHTAAVFALYGADERAEPYIGRTPNLRGRLERLLQPSLKHPKRLQLAGRVRRIAWQPTGSEFESLLLQFDLLQKIYGAKVLERMHLRAPAFVRFLGSNQYPRVVVTHRPSQREGDWAYGPFQSRAAAERYVDEALKLFLLRRCTDDLNPDPAFPGCVYSEMKMCLAPCFKGCSEERYAEESAAVESFLATRGESRLVTLRAQREQAAADLEFETAAALHAQVQKVEGVRVLASELVRPMSKLRAVILHAAANPGEVAVFLYEHGSLRGPAGFSTVGMRIQNEQSGSTSLFAQPLAIEPVVEEQEPGTEGLRDSGTKAAAKAHRTMLETRLEETIATLSANQDAPSATVRQGHLALLKRWYYRPEAKRTGEIFFPDSEDAWPIRPILRGVGRVAAKALAPARADA
jgi:excinuclease UvrABC nuclease subunit